MLSLDKVIKDAQILFKEKNPDAKNIVDDFLSERKEQAEIEERRYEIWSKK